MSQELSDDFLVELTGSQHRIYGFILKRLLNREQAMEVLQETNLVLCRKAADFIPGTNFMAWAMQIAHFQILAYRQKQQRERLVFDDDILDFMNKESGLTDNETSLSALENCLEELPENQKAIIVHRYQPDGSVQYIASQLNKSPNSVSKLLQRIRDALKDCVESRLRAEAQF